MKCSCCLVLWSYRYALPVEIEHRSTEVRLPPVAGSGAAYAVRGLAHRVLPHCFGLSGLGAPRLRPSVHRWLDSPLAQARPSKFERP